MGSARTMITSSAFAGKGVGKGVAVRHTLALQNIMDVKILVSVDGTGV